MGKKSKLPSSKKKIAIVVSGFYKDISEGLLQGAIDELHSAGISDKQVGIFRCPGSFEIPLTARKLCASKKYGAVVCLGAVIKGETAHFEYISYAVTKGIMQVNLEYGIPVSFGVLTCYNEQQAIERSKPGGKNKGAEAARAAVEMMNLIKKM
jgi:6,7-dimethyl-8-ribityllumazine synthase